MSANFYVWVLLCECVNAQTHQRKSDFTMHQLNMCLKQQTSKRFNRNNHSAVGSPSVCLRIHNRVQSKLYTVLQQHQ